MIIPLPEYSFDVKKLLRSHSSRENKDGSYNPNAGCLPLQTSEYITQSLDSVTHHPWLPSISEPNREWCSLAEVITEESPAQFTTRFQVESINPPITQTSGSNCLRDLCILSKDEDGLEKAEFRFVLHVSDAVAELDVIVPDDTAEVIIGSRAKLICAEEVSNQLQNEIYERLDQLFKEPWAGSIDTFRVNGTKIAILEHIFRIPP